MSKEREPAWELRRGARRATEGLLKSGVTAGAVGWRSGNSQRFIGRCAGKTWKPFRAIGRDRRNPVRLAGSVSAGWCRKPESPGSRCGQRRDAAAEIIGCRSEHEQRTVARKDSPYGGRTPFGLAEAEAMSQAASPFAERLYGVVRVTRDWEMARSSFYYQRQVAAQPERMLRRRGPKTAWSDAALLGKIREVLAASPFYGEGHRKVWAGCASRRAHVEGTGVTADARSAAARAVTHAPEARGPRRGTIMTARPKEVWPGITP